MLPYCHVPSVFWIKKVTGSQIVGARCVGVGGGGNGSADFQRQDSFVL